MHIRFYRFCQNARDTNITNTLRISPAKVLKGSLSSKSYCYLRALQLQANNFSAGEELESKKRILQSLHQRLKVVSISAWFHKEADYNLASIECSSLIMDVLQFSSRIFSHFLLSHHQNELFSPMASSPKRSWKGTTVLIKLARPASMGYIPQQVSDTKHQRCFLLHQGCVMGLGIIQLCCVMFAHPPEKKLKGDLTQQIWLQNRSNHIKLNSNQNPT